MHGSGLDLQRLQALLDASYAAAGEHLLRIHSPDKRLTAEQVAERLQGMVLLSLATVTADGRPIVGPVDSIFFRGAFVFGSAPDSIRFRHIRARPAVSATHLPGEELSVTVHGRAVGGRRVKRPAAAGAARRLRAPLRRELGVVHGFRARSTPASTRSGCSRTPRALGGTARCHGRSSGTPPQRRPLAHAGGEEQQPVAHAVRPVARPQPALGPQRERPGPRVDHHDRGPPRPDAGREALEAAELVPHAPSRRRPPRGRRSASGRGVPVEDERESGRRTPRSARRGPAAARPPRPANARAASPVSRERACE